ncbi:MAG: 6-phosphogluconolactonase [Wenzhouxiangellaceae bacterium]
MIREFRQRETLAQALAHHIASQLWQAIDQRDSAYLMLSGGSTPVAMLKALSALALPWAQITVTLADERWVDESSEHSNSQLIRTHLLQGPAAAAHYQPLYQGGDIDDAVAAMNKLEWTRQAPDVLVLGMGSDGHTASLFPDLADWRRWCDINAPEALLAVATEASPLARISFSGRILQRARCSLLHIHGDEKRQLLDSGQAQSLPIGEFLAQSNVWWAP